MMINLGVNTEEKKADHIEYWYDKSTKLWVIQVIATDGYEYSDGEYEYREHMYHGSVKNAIIKEWCKEYGVEAKRV